MTDKNEKSTWLKLDTDMYRLLEQCAADLPEESVSSVKHYIDHSEYEMAFEGLFLDLIAAGKMPIDVAPSFCRKLGRFLGLDSETVLDDEFWDKFIGFMDQVENDRRGTGA